MPDLIEKAGRAEQMEFFVTSEEYPQKPIEPDEVVHMGMGDEYMGNPQELSRRKGNDVTEVKEEGASLKEKIDKKRRISEWSVYKGWMELWLHLSPSREISLFFNISLSSSSKLSCISILQGKTAVATSFHSCISEMD